jgi:hypothetical protein
MDAMRDQRGLPWLDTLNDNVARMDLSSVGSDTSPSSSCPARDRESVRTCSSRGSRHQNRFYTQQHTHYCGIDLHARSMYLCVLNQAVGLFFIAT